MRRNLRLYWRALALLGALLSIIIDWPGMMVCALPATLLQPNTTTSAARLQQQHAHTMDKLLAANATYAAFQNATNTTNTYRSDSVGDVVVADGVPVNGNFTLNINLNTNRNSSHNSNYSESAQAHDEEAADATTELPKSRQAKNATTIMGANVNNKRSGGSESVRQAGADHAPAQHAPPTFSDDQLHNAQRIKMLNLISNKRKRKKFSNADEAHELTSTSSSSSSGANTDQPATTTVAGDHHTTTTTTATTPLSFSANSISNKYLITNNRNTNENLQMAAAPIRTLNKLETTTTTATPSIATSYVNYIEEQVQATSDDALEDEASSLDNMLTSTSASDYEDQFERASRPSISYNSYTTASPDDNDGVGALLNSAAAAAAAPPSSAFTFASAHHTAILLSRTERSVRQSAPASTQAEVSSASRRAVRHHGGANTGGMVRRSSDGSPKSRRLNNFRNLNGSRHMPNNLDRNERSTISHLSGLARKIQIYIKNRFIQLLPDGTVNGTQEEQSDYTILQRSTVDVGRIKIQGVATCLYLCMDACGAVYGSKEFTDDCVFNENMEQHNYNTYSSTFNSNARRVYYLALNRHGEPRKLQIPPTRSLGKLATYTNAITETVDEVRVEQLIAKNFGENRIKHGIRQLCDTGKPLVDLIDSKHFKALPKCNPNSSNNNSGSNSNSNSSSKKSSSSSRSSSGSGSSSSPVVGSDSDSPSGSSSISGQSMNNVPAANERGESQSSTVTNSHSNHNGRGGQRGGNASNSLSSSISNSSTTSNGGHTSGNSSQNALSHQNHNGGDGKKKKKRRKCRPHENEEEHNCQRSPLALRKRGNIANNKKCREQLTLQRQQRRQLKAKGEKVPFMPLPAACKKKKNGGGAGGKKNRQNQNQNGNNRNGVGDDDAGANNRRGKKLNANARQAGGVGDGADNRNGGANRKKGRNGGAQAQKKSKKQTPAKTTSTTTTSTTQATSSSTVTTAASTTTTRQNADSTTVAAALSMPPTTTELSSAEVEQSLDPRAEVTSVRGEREREQRNVRYTNSMEDDARQASAAAATAVAAENSSSHEESTEAEASEEEEHSEDVVGTLTGASDEEDADDDGDEMYDESEESVAAAPPASSAAATASLATSGGKAAMARAHILGDADDFLYYDQFDFLPIGLWKLLALYWLTHWALRRQT
ncbi:serine-rich adhesin for platelets isoform X1 [Zeugodacus cucurbitae]|uniref:serine-rich adhesin for platelets isoform X1 n=2 Tax=Zeugodacus cucurbitae TaxID=28588 RepID=UPI0023D938A4|nr:serine-rich adhesin for platelets isoform X1 [Zeugodacus cucurbitae]XP_054091974.1 serine-rich adhesin for platelets isoform X1 [Zeugodacus cucurbitae]XP_054091978.1 serine-rich adhesin for platelets isoform X1 [Zeugodacus cucurbitae]XP_054091982.1 serine-rich adhesin for platelets isoform X1 [Zeugodacus cucurbitae]XP_054091989.1 serine-rich adhesin for platelets isoform X1 [Zeugodacus cucurbitae]